MIRYYVYLFPTNNLIPTSQVFVNYFYATQNQYMLFWLLKDA